MTWSYSPAALASSSKDRVRLLIGDTDSAAPQLQDEEIAFLVTQRGSEYLAGADACRRLAAKYARQVDTTNLSLSVSASQRAAAYKELAEQLETQALSVGGGAQMFVGGLSKSGKAALDADTDAVQPAFRIGQDDLPGTDPSTTE